MMTSTTRTTTANSATHKTLHLLDDIAGHFTGTPFAAWREQATDIVEALDARRLVLDGQRRDALNVGDRGLAAEIASESRLVAAWLATAKSMVNAIGAIVAATHAPAALAKKGRRLADDPGRMLQEMGF